MFNPFKLFEITESFEVDTTALKQRYLELQKQYHPDNFTHSPDQESQAIQQSALINDAWNILKDPLKRAEYLLEQALGDEVMQKNLPDPEFLMEQMEKYEALENIETKQDLDQLEILLQQVEAEQKDLLQEFAQQWQAQAYLPAKQIFQRLQFGNKLLQEIARVEEKLTDF